MPVFYTCLKKIAILFLIGTFLSGCAPGSKNIEANYVSPLQYQSYDCNQIGQEMSRVGRKVSEVSGQQDSTAGKDAAMIGISIVFWPSLFFLAAGENHKEEIARLKGEADALEQCAINKQCTTVLAQIEEAKKLQVAKKVDPHLVEAKLQECIDLLGRSSCKRRDFEAEVRKEQATTMQSLEKPVTPNSNNEPQTASIQPSLTAQPQHKSSMIEVYKTKCPGCSNVVTYHAKYTGNLTTCMQCDKRFNLP